MRRSGRINESVPAFFTRSRAKNFFNTTPTRTGRREDNEKQKDEPQTEIKVEDSKKKEVRAIKVEEKSIEKPKQELELQQDQDEQQQKDQQSPNNGTTPCNASGENQSPKIEVTDFEMKVEEEVSEIPVVKMENSVSQAKQHKDVSATTKALQKMQQMMDSKKNWKKKQKLPLCIRRRKMNERLNKILMPKSGLIFLHELKPGCTFKVQEQQGSNPPVFVAQVEYNDKVLAVGQGMTKPSAKNAAAENAIKVLVAEALTQQAVRFSRVTETEETQQCDSPAVDDLMDATDDVSLAGLASFAMYKMFSEWQSQGTDFPLLSFQQKKKPVISKALVMKKELPPNADKLHPSFLLNTMRPGVVSIEVDRSAKDNVSSVTMAFEIDGKVYKGSGPNKKEARKRAAQIALTDLYGLKYEA